MYVDADRAGYQAGDRMDPVAFTPPFARTEVNCSPSSPNWRTSQLPYRVRGWVDSIRTGAPIVSPASDADSAGSSTPATARVTARREIE